MSKRGIFPKTCAHPKNPNIKQGLHLLRNDPTRRPVGRDYSVRYFGQFRIVYCLDPLVQEIRIVEIESVRPK
jgi:hypothetical protein